LAFPLADPAAAKKLADSCDVVEGVGESREDFLAALEDAEAVILRPPARMDAEAFSHAPRLKVIANIGTGLDHVDLDVARARAVTVIGGDGANAQAVAEFVVAMMIVAHRRLADAMRLFISGQLDWSTRARQLRGSELAGGTLGIVGYGAIGRRLAEIASRGLGMRTVFFDPYVSDGDEDIVAERCGSLVELLEQSRTLSIHVPLSNETRHLIGTPEIARLPRGSVLVNTSRGGVVDEEAVIAALREGHLAGAVWDVFGQEPPSPQRLAELAEVPGLIITPHIAGISQEAGAALAWAAVNNVLSNLM
jgi:phosphoglycerate dehydrogenase-like enzyme